MQADVITTGTARRIEGPLLFLRRNINVGLNEAVEVIDKDNHARLGRIATLDNDSMIIEVLETTSGLSLVNSKVRFLGEPLHFSVGPDLLGRVLDGVGRPLDSGPPISATKRFRIDGNALNPAARAQSP